MRILLVWNTRLVNLVVVSKFHVLSTLGVAPQFNCGIITKISLFLDFIPFQQFFVNVGSTFLVQQHGRCTSRWFLLPCLLFQVGDLLQIFLIKMTETFFNFIFSALIITICYTIMVHTIWTQSRILTPQGNRTVSSKHSVFVVLTKISKISLKMIILGCDIFCSSTQLGSKFNRQILREISKW